MKSLCFETTHRVYRRYPSWVGDGKGGEGVAAEGGAGAVTSVPALTTGQAEARYAGPTCRAGHCCVLSFLSDSSRYAGQHIVCLLGFFNRS